MAVNGRQKSARKELQRHCDEVYLDPEETREVQEERIEFFKRGQAVYEERVRS